MDISPRNFSNLLSYCKLAGKTLEMILKPEFFQLRAGTLDLYPTSLYFDVLFMRWDLY